MGRLWEINKGSSNTTTRFLYDGDALIAEYDGLGNMTNRYVHGGGVDQPLLWYQGDGTDAASQRGLFANWQGSITAVTDATGNAIGVNGYDAYGIPNETNIGRFQYTGQIWLAELGLYYYKARVYSPTLGRFLQTDPIGYEDQYNLYAYVGNDPVNLIDPTGLFACAACTAESGLSLQNRTRRDDDGFQKPDNSVLRSSGHALTAQETYLDDKKNYNWMDPTGGDGHLSLEEANRHARQGNGAAIVVDASQLTVKLNGERYRKGTTRGAVVQGAGDFLVYGTVELLDDGTLLVNDYDFNLNGTIGSIPRDIETTIGKRTATVSGAFKIQEFGIYFNGKPKVIK